ncbi:MAG: hypothetical protein K0S09_1323 [Sphingobacteriaceae bacterium]|jgi:hypothetical protein|nr:hypothetical protein [Sphingobacteriaceae bacterium]
MPIVSHTKGFVTYTIAIVTFSKGIVSYTSAIVLKHFGIFCEAKAGLPKTLRSRFHKGRIIDYHTSRIFKLPPIKKTASLRQSPERQGYNQPANRYKHKPWKHISFTKQQSHYSDHVYQSDNFELRNSDFDLRNRNCELRNRDFDFRNRNCVVRNRRFVVRNRNCEVRNPGFELRNRNCELRNDDFELRNCHFNLRNCNCELRNRGCYLLFTFCSRFL